MRTQLGTTVVRMDDVPWQNLEARDGIYIKSATFGDDSTRRYLRAVVGKTSATAISPRHKHTFEQLRYFIEGDAKYGNVIYHPGDCVYFPEAVAYGPQVGYNDTDSTQIVLQWGGPSGVYYPSGDEQGAAKRALDEHGEFRDGVYFPKSGKPRDGFEAILEHITQAPVAYAPARYDAPIRMRTSAYAAIPDPADAHVRIQHLARFNECGPEIEMYSVAAGGTLAAQTPAADRLLVLLSGDAAFDDRSLSGITLIHTPQGAFCDALTATADCRVLAVTFG
jgi:hypothetical protein